MKIYILLCFLCISFSGISQVIIPLDDNNIYNFDSIKSILKNTQIICLGEDEHRIETFSKFKTELIKYLHLKLNFNNVAFEGSLLNISNAYYNFSSDTLALKESFYSIWQSECLLNLLKYISNKKNSKIHLSGFDFQPTLTHSSSIWLKSIFLNINPDYADLIFKTDTNLINSCGKIRKSINENKMLGIPQETSTSFSLFYSSMIDSLDNKKEELLKTKVLSEFQYKIIRHGILDRKRYSKYLAITDVYKSMRFRDSIMSENINWLINDLYLNEKIILWAHDDHISKKTVSRYKKYKLQSSIEMLPNKTKEKVETISLNSLKNAPKKIQNQIKKMNGNAFLIKNPEYLKGNFEYIIYFKLTESINKFKIL